MVFVIAAQAKTHDYVNLFSSWDLFFTGLHCLQDKDNLFKFPPKSSIICDHPSDLTSTIHVLTPYTVTTLPFCFLTVLPSLLLQNLENVACALPGTLPYLTASPLVLHPSPQATSNTARSWFKVHFLKKPSFSSFVSSVSSVPISKDPGLCLAAVIPQLSLSQALK